MYRLFFNPGKYNSAASFGLLVLRIASGAAMMTHGYPKLLKLLAGPPYKFADPIGLGVTASLFLIVFAEFFCSLMLILGLGTRLAAIPLIISMLVVIFISKSGQTFGDIELPFLFLSVYIAIAFTGAGKYSVDGAVTATPTGF